MAYVANIEVSVPQNIEMFRGRPFFRVRIDVTSVEGFPDTNLFVHRRRMYANGDHQDEYIGTCGPVDIVDMPTTPTAERMYFRKDHVDMLLESHHLFDELVTLVRSGLQELVDGSRRLEQMQIVQTFEVR